MIDQVDKGAAVATMVGAAALGAAADGQISLPLGLAVTIGIFLAGVGWGLIRYVAVLTAEATEIKVAARDTARSVERHAEAIERLRADDRDLGERVAKIEGAG